MILDPGSRQCVSGWGRGQALGTPNKSDKNSEREKDELRLVSTGEIRWKGRDRGHLDLPLGKQLISQQCVPRSHLASFYLDDICCSVAVSQNIVAALHARGGQSPTNMLGRG